MAVEKIDDGILRVEGQIIDQPQAVLDQLADSLS
jgi:hypothetical protein